MRTRNGTSFIFNHDVPTTMTVAQVSQGNITNSVEVMYGCEEAVDQFEDILNKFDCLPTEYRTLIWGLLRTFMRDHGYKAIEDGGVVPQ